jgi:cytochrome c oxidase subunit 2
MKKWIILLPLILVGCNVTPAVDESGGSNPEGEVVEQEGQTQEGQADGGQGEEGEVVEVTLSARNFTFGQEEIRVKQGDRVRVTINNTQGTHDFVIDEFEVNSGIIATGSSTTVEFIAGEPGSYAYYCDVGNHRKLGMEGTLVVE